MLLAALLWLAAQDARRVDAELERVLVAEVRTWSTGTPPEREELAALLDEAAGLAAPELLQALGNLGHRLGELGRRDEARALVRWCADEARAQDERALAAWALEWLGQDAWVRGELVEARELLLAAAEEDGRRGAALDEVRHRADAARILLTLGRLDEALAEVRANSERVARAGSDAAVRAAAEVRASLLYELGRHRAALELVLAHAPLAADVPRDEQQVRLDLTAASLLADVGRLETAEGHARRAHALALEPEVARRAPLLHLEAKLELGLLLGDLGRTDEGLALLDEAAREFARLDDPRGAAWAEKNRGFVLLAAGRAAEAAEALERAGQRGEELGVPYLAALGALGAAEARAELDPRDARLAPALAEVEARAQALGERQLMWRCAALRGRIELARGAPAAALRALRGAVEAIEAWRRTLSAAGLVEHALASRADVYRDAALAALRSGAPEEALALAGLLQARLVDELGARREGPLPSVPDAELARLRERLGELEWLGARAEAGELASLRAELDRRLLAADLAHGRVLAGEARAVPLDALRAGLARERLDTALVFVIGPRGGLALRLDVEPERALVAVELDLQRATLELLVARLRAPGERLEAGEVDLAHLDFDVAAARELHARLVAPLALEDGRRVALLLDDGLLGLPFEALVSGGVTGSFDPRRPGAHFAGLELLGDRHALVRVSSLARLARPRAARVGETHLVQPPEALAPAGAAHELARLAELLPDARHVQAAGIAELEASLARAARVHLSAHGELDAARPAHGALQLGGDGAPVARFEAWRAAELPLDGLEVVLAACHSGRGAWRAGAGLAGLTGGFLAGGAREVVASQWAVDDRSSVEFFAAYHAARTRGEDAPAALLAARLALRARFPHPFHRTAWFVQR